MIDEAKDETQKELGEAKGNYVSVLEPSPGQWGSQPFDGVASPGPPFQLSKLRRGDEDIALLWWRAMHPFYHWSVLLLDL